MIPVVRQLGTSANISFHLVLKLKTILGGDLYVDSARIKLH